MRLPGSYIFIRDHALKCELCGHIPAPNLDGVEVRVRRGEQFVCIPCAELINAATELSNQPDRGLP